MYYISLDITVTIQKMWTYIGQEMGLEYLFFIEREEESFIYIGGIILFFHCYQNQPSLTQLLKS